MKVLLVLGGLALAAGTWIYSNTTNSDSDTNEPRLELQKPQDIINETPQIVEFEGVRYAYEIYQVNDLSKIHIASNLTRLTSSSLYLEKENCTFLTNGGFYTKENSHIGWVQQRDVQISPYSESSLFNGFLFFENDSVIISRSVRSSALQGFQSGPLLFADGEPLVLSIKNDKAARRIVAITTPNTDHLYFVAIHAEKSTSVGPLLSNVPSVIGSIASQQKIEIVDAINLDGGSHSVFLSDSAKIQEINPVGTFLCYKE